jgi:hypothetical protein
LLDPFRFVIAAAHAERANNVPARGLEDLPSRESRPVGVDEVRPIIAPRDASRTLNRHPMLEPELPNELLRRPGRDPHLSSEIRERNRVPARATEYDHEDL